MVIQAVEYLETQDDFEEAQIQAVQRWVADPIPFFEPETGGITFTDHGTHTHGEDQVPGG